MANPRRSATVYPSVAALGADRGPDITKYAVTEDKPYLYEWIPGDVTAIDSDLVVGHTGGTIGRWKACANSGGGIASSETVTVTGTTTRTPALSATYLGGEIVSLTGSNRGAAINAAITAQNAAGGGTVWLLPGTYTIETAIIKLSSVAMRAVLPGATKIATSMAPAVGLADTYTNALVKVQGSVSVSPVNTTLADTAESGTDIIVVASATGIAANAYLIVEGRNTPGNPTDSLDMSDDEAIILTEIVQVASTYVSGTTIPLTAPLKQWHSTGLTVKSCTPIRDVVIDGIYFDCAGGTMANCILGEYVKGLKVTNCEFRGFSRACIELRSGPQDFDIDGIRSHGEVNSIVWGRSAMVGEIKNVRCDPDGKRFHANGVPRGLITFWSRCTSIRVADCLLQRACCGLRTWGGWHIQHSNIQIRDMDGLEIRNRDQAYGVGVVLGVGIDSGTSALGTLGEFCLGEEFAYDIGYDDISISDCIGSDETGDFAWFCHDIFKVHATNVVIMNHGVISGTVVNGRTIWANGLRTNDATGAIDAVYVSGCTRGIHTTGGSKLDIDLLYFDGSAGNGSAGIALYLDAGGAGANPRIRNFRMTNGGGINFGSGFLGNPDYRFGFGKFFWDDWTWTGVALAENVSGNTLAFGDVVEFTAGGTRRVTQAGGASNKCAAVAWGGANNTPVLVAPLPAEEAQVTCSSAAVAVGEYLEANASRQGVVQATPSFTTFGRALSSKGAGSAGLVRVGPR